MATPKTTSPATVPSTSRATARTGATANPTPSSSASGSMTTAKSLPDVVDPQVLNHLVGDLTAIKDFKRSAAAYRGACSKAFVAANNGINLKKTNPSSDADKTARLYMDGYRTSLQRSQVAYQKWRYVLDDEAADYATAMGEVDAKLAELDDSSAKLEAHFLQAFKTVLPAPVTVATAQQPGPIAATMVDTSLKPTVLTRDDEIDSFDKWTRMLKGYFDNNRYHIIAAETQLLHVEKFVEPGLFTQAKQMSDNSSQAFEDGIGIVAALETIFQQQYPLLIHRVEFLTRNQTGESPLDYISTMRKLAQYADLANLSPDLILASRIVSGMKDGQCKSKCLGLKNPSTDDVQKKATEWLVTQKKKKGTQLDKKEEARAVDTSSSSTKPNQNNGQRKPCSVCNSTKHDRETCKHKSTAHCNRCEKDGHFPQACRSKAKSGNNGQKGKGGPWKGKDKAKAAVNTSSSSDGST